MRNPGKFHQIFIPKCCQQPRSKGPTRRRLPSGFMFEFSSCKDASSSLTTASMDKCSLFSRCSEELRKFPLVGHDILQDGRYSEFYLKPTAVSPVEVESVNASSGTYTNGNQELHKNLHITPPSLPCTPNKLKSQSTESCSDHMTPGSVVWAKTASDTWWPAEVMDEREAQSSTSNESVNGLVLVQFYGNSKYCWVDPVESLSLFDDCFEERSSNPQSGFQDALKQALYKKEQISPYKQSGESPHMLKGSSPNNLSSDKCNGSSSSRAEDDCCERGRGKRKRKPKLHFDEVNPVKSITKSRRLKIMRHLGLTAPLGSPFSPTSHVRTAYKSSGVLDV